MIEASCPYCNPAGEAVLWRGEKCRVVLVEEPGFAGWCRVIWHTHEKEFSDLGPDDRNHLMFVVSATESALRRLLAPAKMNLAALGTQAPHLHWHVIPRFSNDPTYPRPVWAADRSETSGAVLPSAFEGKMKDMLAVELDGA